MLDLFALEEHGCFAALRMKDVNWANWLLRSDPPQSSKSMLKSASVLPKISMRRHHASWQVLDEAMVQRSFWNHMATCFPTLMSEDVWSLFHHCASCTPNIAGPHSAQLLAIRLRWFVCEMRVREDNKHHHNCHIQIATRPWLYEAVLSFMLNTKADRTVKISWLKEF